MPPWIFAVFLKRTLGAERYRSSRINFLFIIDNILLSYFKQKSVGQKCPTYEKRTYDFS